MNKYGCPSCGSEQINSYGVGDHQCIRCGLKFVKFRIDPTMFNPEQFLIDNGFKKSQEYGSIVTVYTYNDKFEMWIANHISEFEGKLYSHWIFHDEYIEPTKENFELIINAAKLLEQITC